MVKAYTDLEQSRKLAKILPIESADMWWPYYYDVVSDTGEYNKEPLLHKPICDPDKAIPCWSLTVLMNLLPSEFTEKGEHSETTYKIDIRKYALTDDADIYQIAYGNYRWYEDGSRSWSDMINTGEKEDLLDAAFQMVCWLKENKKI